MLLLYNIDRPLQLIAADAWARRHLAARTPELPWRTVSASSPASAPPLVHDPRARASGTSEPDLAQMIAAALVGDLDQVEDVLTADVEVWSPSVYLRSREEVTAALRDEMPVLAIVAFEIEHLTRTGATVFAEWRLVARQSDPLLVDDDVLVETTDEPITLGGVTMARVRDGGIARLHSYYDAAALIEQLIVRPRGTPGDRG